MEDLIPNAKELVGTFGITIVVSIVILIVGRIMAGILSSIVKRMLTRSKVEETLVKFAGNLTYYFLIAFVVLAAIANLGVQTTSFIAVLGAAGLAIGLALQGSLSNFASGVLLIMFRPFKVGDYVEAAGTAGVIEDLQIFTTTLKTPDNKKVIIPNSNITGGTITNYSANETRRVDLTAGIGYGDDIDKAKAALNEVLASDERILKDPEWTVAVVEMGDSSVNFVVRPWVKTADYWGVYFDITEAIKKRFDADGISIPFPQRDVHVYEHKD
ncbi:MAG: mechanosensitive ion channel [Candidatus Latescibacteria bacterium]|jgi:small conductance mechanosensitive channel|nr:mechanosensitive ion channel [Candidatus Latescibacterota bacterium]